MATFEVVYTFFNRERPPFPVTCDSPEEALVAFRRAKPAVIDSEIRDVREVPKVKNPRGWTPAKRQFFFEMFTWLREVGPQKEPFGREGKKMQADWRERSGLSFVDPVQSNLSSWGVVLSAKGYVRQREDGLWTVTDKNWED